AILALKKGAQLLKYGQRGKPKVCPFRLSTEAHIIANPYKSIVFRIQDSCNTNGSSGSSQLPFPWLTEPTVQSGDITFSSLVITNLRLYDYECSSRQDEKLLIWYSGQEEKQLRLSSVTSITRGQRTKQVQPERECQSFSLIYGDGDCSLDLICKDKTQADSWYLGLRAVIAKRRIPRLFGTSDNRRGAKSCISSPAGYMRRKHILGLPEETKFTKVRSFSGSPPQSFSERCFSDGLSCSSDSLFSESTLSNTQNVMDISNPSSPYIETNDLIKKAAVCGSIKHHGDLPGRHMTPAHESPQMHKNVLRDVLIWGEGIEGGFLGSRADNIGYRNGMHLDSLLPKLYESTKMLDVQKISIGGKHSALVTKQGELFCWGEGKGGKLGHKVDMDFSSPKVVDSLIGVHVKFVACGEYQTCALTRSGEVYTWGNSCYGNDLAGVYSKRSQWMPLRVCGALDGFNILHIACGEWHMAMVSTSGKLFTCGDGTFGVLGHGNLQSISKPKEVESLNGLWVKYVSCGPWHTAAIVEIKTSGCKSNNPGGKLFTWGDGDKGRLGHADQERKLLPTCVSQLVNCNFVQLSCGTMLTVGLTNMGVVYTMGGGVHGQLGNPGATDKSVTIVQGMLKNEFVREISSGSYHNAALTSKGNVYTWGKGANGQLGLGDADDRNSPTLVEALRDRQVESITCGSTSTAAICLHKSISCTDQSACRGCSVGFGFTRKKHNCYNCGLLFCRACSTKKITNACLAPSKSKPFRVCDPCFNQLQMTAHSRRLPELINPVNKEDRAEATATLNQMGEDSHCREKKTTRNQGVYKQRFYPISSVSSGLPRWGHVSSPVLFRKCYKDQRMASILALENQMYAGPPLGSQDMPLKSDSATITSVKNVERDLSDSDKILTNEIQKLRAQSTQYLQAENLENQCQTRREKIQEYQRRTEEAWALSKKEAAKCKAAKDVVKHLTSRLHILSQKLSTGREAKEQNLPQIKSMCPDSPTMKVVNEMFIAGHKTPVIGQLEDRKPDSLSNSPIAFSNQLTMQNRDTYCGDTRLADESCARRREPGKNGSRGKLEWLEQYQPGVYITFIALPSGHNRLHRVRFSLAIIGTTTEQAVSFSTNTSVERLLPLRLKALLSKRQFMKSESFQTPYP
ncbi:hypothetical protein RJ640_009598, partial [Escallonia rubra]